MIELNEIEQKELFDLFDLQWAVHCDDVCLESARADLSSGSAAPDVEKLEEQVVEFERELADHQRQLAVAEITLSGKVRAGCADSDTHAYWWAFWEDRHVKKTPAALPLTDVEYERLLEQVISVEANVRDLTDDQLERLFLRFPRRIEDAHRFIGDVRRELNRRNSPRKSAK